MNYSSFSWLVSFLVGHAIKTNLCCLYHPRRRSVMMITTFPSSLPPMLLSGLSVLRASLLLLLLFQWWNFSSVGSSVYSFSKRAREGRKEGRIWCHRPLPVWGSHSFLSAADSAVFSFSRYISKIANCPPPRSSSSVATGDQSMK